MKPYIMDNDEMIALIEHCEKRFNKYSSPCAHCSYKSLIKDTPSHSCIFSNCPRAWDMGRN